MTPTQLLDIWLAERLDPVARGWLASRVEHAARAGADAGFFLAFSIAPRKVGREDLRLSPEALLAASEARRGFQPGGWTVDQAARTRLVLALPSADADAFVRTLDSLFDDGDLGELVTLYQALPLLPHPERHRARAAEGIRTNMLPVLEAVALRNPYPAEQLEPLAWNQLVLKCLFVGADLGRVWDLEARATPELARMLSDFAHERWAAGRPVPPALWRCLGPVADGRLLSDLERVLSTGKPYEQAAVGLAARHNPNAEGILAVHAAAVDRALVAYPTWDAVTRAAREGAAP